MLGLVLLMSMAMGLTMGVAADSPAEATIDIGKQIEEMDFSESEGEAERRARQQLGALAPMYDKLQSFEIDTPADPYIRAGVIQFTKTVVRGALTLANWSAFVGYHYLGWMPAIVVEGFVQLTMLGGIGWIQYRQVSRMHDLRETHQ